MTLEDVFDQLVHGELRHLFVSPTGEVTDELPAEKRKQILSSVQLGLLDLYRRFLLRENTIVLELSPSKRTYVLDAHYAQSNARSIASVKYINDSETPFLDDLFKVERVYNEAGVEMAINDVDDPESLRTPSLNMIWVPDTLKDTRLKVVYRACHPALDKVMGVAAPGQVKISLPGSHLDLLLLYVASRVTTPIGMSQEFHEGNNYAAKYEAEVARMLNINFAVAGTNESTRFRNNGWC